jgi:HTH-type transcriptional regulator, sugar sensing transcriptional regulator
MLKRYLEDIGFNERKSGVYLALLRLGQGSAQEIANITGIKRTTAYNILKTLCDDKLASISFVGKKRVFIAEPPERLKNLLEEKLSVFDTALPLLKEAYNMNSTKLPIRYYEGKDGIKLVVNELLNAKQKEYFYFGSMSLFVDCLGQEFMEKFIQKRIKLKIWSNAIRFRKHEINNSITAASPENYRRLKYIPKEIGRNVATILLYDNKVTIHSSASENYGMIIESKELFVLLKTVWDFVWEMAEE